MGQKVLREHCIQQSPSRSVHSLPYEMIDAVIEVEKQHVDQLDEAARLDVESLDHLSRDKTASPPEGPERREDITDDDDDDDDDDEKEERNSLDAAKGAKTDGESKEEEKKPYRVNREEMEEKLKRAKV
eukprot:3304876-Rhodomonas_salina.2